jgi:hypothetical protein
MAGYPICHTVRFFYFNSFDAAIAVHLTVLAYHVSYLEVFLATFNTLLYEEGPLPLVRTRDVYGTVVKLHTTYRHGDLT